VRQTTTKRFHTPRRNFLKPASIAVAGVGKLAGNPAQALADERGKGMGNTLNVVIYRDTRRDIFAGQALTPIRRPDADDTEISRRNQ
jgi:hypothetical protein